VSPPLHNAILRFWHRTNSVRRVAGTGFLSKGADGKVYAITCAHVVNLIANQSVGSTSPIVSLRTDADVLGGKPVSLSLRAWIAPSPIGLMRSSPLCDIAIFELTDSPPSIFVPPLRVEPALHIVPPGRQIEFYSFGFMGTDDGLPTNGALTAVDHGGWFVAEGSSSFRRFIEEGLSGAPIFVNGMIVGMITQRLERESKQGLAIPSFALAQVWPPLAQPYPGLPAFDMASSHLFFGRGRPLKGGDAPAGKLKQVIDRLEEQRLVGLMGASGSGKSSLAKAGVAPHYESKGWASIVFRPGLQPLRALAEAISDGIDCLPPGPARLESVDLWAARIEEGDLLAVHSAAARAGAAGVLVVVDQFEEFFLASGARMSEIDRQRELILPQLLQLADNEAARCLLTGRLDLMERMVTGSSTASSMLSDPHPIIVLTKMSAGEVREAIDGPATLFGVCVDGEYTADLAAEATRSEGRLPLLQAALREAWGGLKFVEGNWLVQRPIPRQAVTPSHVLDNALGRRADEAIAALVRGTFEKGGISFDRLQRVLLLLVRIVRGVPTRRLVEHSEIDASDWEILEDLATERLVTIDGEFGTAELVHESLMTEWPLLSDWINADATFLAWRERFNNEFVAWRDRKKQAGDLLRKIDVQTAVVWLTAPRVSQAPPTTEEAEFIRASEAFHEAEDRRRRRQLLQTRIGLGIAVALASGLALAGFLLLRSQQAEQRARVKAQVQESRAIAAQARKVSDLGDQQTAMLLGLAALPNPAYGGNRLMSFEAKAVLQQAWLRNRETTLAGHTGQVSSAKFSLDGKHAVTVSDDGTSRLWSLSAGRPTSVLLDTIRNPGPIPIVAGFFLPNGTRIATVANDGQVHIWDTKTPQLLPRTFGMQMHPVIKALVTNDGTKLALVPINGPIVVWALDHPVPTSLNVGLTSPAPGGEHAIQDSLSWSDASFSPDGLHLLAASLFGKVRIWDLSGQVPTDTVLKTPDSSTITAATWSANGGKIVVAMLDGSALLFDPHAAQQDPILLKGNSGEIDAVAFNADGTRLATGSKGGEVRLWDIGNNSPSSTLLGSNGSAVNAVRFNNTSTQLLSSSDDRLVHLYDVQVPGSPSRTFVGHEGAVVDASFSSDDNRAISASRDGTARIWDLNDSRGLTPSLGLSSPTTSGASDKATESGGLPSLSTRLHRHVRERAIIYATLRADSRYALTISDGRVSRLWDLSDSPPVVKFATQVGGGSAMVSFLQDGKNFSILSRDGTLRIYNVLNPEIMSVVPPPQDSTRTIMFASPSPDGSKLAAVGVFGEVLYWDLSVPKVTQLGKLDGGPAAVAVSPDGKYVLAGSTGSTSRVYDLSGAMPRLISLASYPAGIIGGAFSRNPPKLVTVSADRAAEVWNLANSHPVPTFLDHDNTCAPVISADSREAVTCNSDNTAHLWDLSQSRPKATQLTGSSGPIGSAALADDGKQLLTMSAAGGVQVWNLLGGSPTNFSLQGHQGAVLAGAFSADGSHVITASQDGTARVWPIYPDTTALIELVKANLTRCLSSSQRDRYGVVPSDSSKPADLVSAPDQDGTCQ
jgi:WD40 repeat protein